MKLKDIHEEIKKFDLVQGVHRMKKSEAITTLKNLQLYAANKVDYDYYTYKFGEKEIRINDEQYNVVTSNMDINMKVLACAGSGKTTTILCRIKYLIDKGVNPSKIMLTTFSCDAAQNLKNKIFELFGFTPRLTIGTIDSISCKFYHKYFKQDHFIGINEYGTEFLKFLNSQEGCLVLDDYEYVFFDEFQDVNSTQFDILRCFYNNGAKIIVIGDDAQNIYQFRGSDVKFIINLEKYFSNLITFRLVNNYRSTPEIISFANQSIDYNIRQIKKEMFANLPSISLKPQIDYYMNIKDQNNGIIKQIEQLVSEGMPLTEIAILSRNMFPLKKIEESIEKRGIKYVSLITEANSDTKPRIKDGHLTITTIHKSKGLEWTVVFIIGADDKHFPAEIDKLSIEEERRLFYVAVTRAKKYLYISFLSTGSFVPKISRFVQEISKDSYDFLKSDPKYYNFSDDRGLKYFNSVTEFVQNINEKDISILRDTNILLKINPEVNIIHGPHILNQTIETYYLQADFGEYIDRYLCRNIGYKKGDKRLLEDRCAKQVINACIVKEAKYKTYLRYKKNFEENIKYITKSTKDYSAIKLLNQNVPKKITVQDCYTIITIVKKIINRSIEFRIKPEEIYITSEKLLPNKFRDRMLVSYKNYQDLSLENSAICRDIYNVSLCSSIVNNRRRLLYKDVFEDFNYDKKIYEDIDSYVNIIIDKELKTKMYLNNTKLDIIGEIDLVNCSDCKIIDFKCSTSDNFKLEWLIQLLSYTALFKSLNQNDHINIDKIEIYNVLKGVTFTFDISEWDKHNELMEYYVRMREEKVNRNKSALQVDTSSSIPDNDDIEDDSKEDLIDIDIPDKILYDNDWYMLHLIDNYENDSDKDIVYSLLKDYQDSYKEHKNKKLILDKIEKIIEPDSRRYMVCDTETTGLPQKLSMFAYYPYQQVDKYNSSRLVQLSWGIYNLKNACIKLEDYIIKPNGFGINNSHIHGITYEMAKKGFTLADVIDKFYSDLKLVDTIVGHNIMFDINILKSEMHRMKRMDIIREIDNKKIIDTMAKSKNIVKSPKLGNVFKMLFNKEIENAHNSKYDVINTAKVVEEMVKREIIRL